MLGLDPSISETSAFSSGDSRVRPENDGVVLPPLNHIDVSLGFRLGAVPPLPQWG